MTDPIKAADAATEAAAKAATAAREKADADKAEEEQPKASATAHDVTLERSNNEKIAIEYVRDWEIEILRAVHGQDRVFIRDTYDIDLTGEDASPVREYQRLKAKYNRKGENIQVVESVLGHDPSVLAKKMGVKYDRSMEDGGMLPMSENIDNRPSKKKK